MSAVTLRDVRVSTFKFYSVVSRGTRAEFENLWAVDSTVSCAQPHRRPAVGHAAVMQIWAPIFHCKNRMSIDIDNINVVMGRARDRFLCEQV